MRITFLFPFPTFTGGCRVVALYAQALADRGHNVTIVTLSGPKRSFIFNIKRLLKREKWLRNRSKDEILRESYFSTLSNVNIILFNSVQNSDIPDGDVIIATWWETAELIMKLSKSKGEKYYFIQGYEIFPQCPIERVKATYRLPITKITIAQWLVDILHKEYGGSKAELVPNSVDTAIFHARARDKQLTPTFGLMYVFAEMKGTDISIAAFEYAKKKYPQIKLIAFGINDIDEELPLPEGATFYLSPSQEKIREIYSQCDGFIFSSRSDGFGLTVLEAMACRCPVVATKTGCAGDYIDNGVSGELNDIGDIEAQGKSIIKIIEMKNKNWKAMSEAAYQAATKYSWQNSYDKFEKSITTKAIN